MSNPVTDVILYKNNYQGSGSVLVPGLFIFLKDTEEIEYILNNMD